MSESRLFLLQRKFYHMKCCASAHSQLSRDPVFFITSAKKDVLLLLSVCLSVSNFVQKKTSERICMKFSGKVGNGPMNK